MASTPSEPGLSESQNHEQQLIQKPQSESISWGFEKNSRSIVCNSRPHIAECHIRYPCMLCCVISSRLCRAAWQLAGSVPFELLFLLRSEHKHVAQYHCSCEASFSMSLDPRCACHGTQRDTETAKVPRKLGGVLTKMPPLDWSFILVNFQNKFSAVLLLWCCKVFLGIETFETPLRIADCERKRENLSQRNISWTSKRDWRIEIRMLSTRRNSQEVSQEPCFGNMKVFPLKEREQE